MRSLIGTFCLALLLTPVDAAQPTLTVLSSNATNALIHELHPQFEKISGYTLRVRFDNSAALKSRIEKGEAFDVAVMTATAIADLAASGKVTAASRRDVARAGVGMAIHPQASKPDISSVDALKGALLTARSIAYVEQGATAVVLRGTAAKLGIADVLNAKTVFVDSAAHAVADRKAEIGFTQISEILNVPGATFAGPLPREVQVYTTFAAAARPNAPVAARQFIELLAGAEAALKQKVGMEPVSTDRLPPIAEAARTPAQKEAVDAFKTARGVDITGPFHPLLRSPELMTRTRAMGDYLRYKSALPPRLSEFVILMTARAWTQQYEWNAHYPIALKAGLKREIADAIAEGRRPTGMQGDETALYELCQELHRNQTVSDATYARAVTIFGEHGVIDAIGISGYYTMLAMVLNTARTPATDNGSPLLRPLPH
jgi:4-carboxymuconolactone decarboxylase